MHVAHHIRRPLADLAVAFAVGICLLLLNVAVTYNNTMHRFLSEYSRVLATGWLINLLFFWMAVLLWLAFVRWRRATRRSVELENVISSISPDALLLVRPDRTIFMSNVSIRRLFGYAPEEIVNRKTDVLYFDRRVDRNRPREIYDALEKDGFHIGVATGRRRNGETFPLEIIAAELSGRTGAVLLLRDISERVEAERERQEFEERIRRRQKLESLGVLAGGIAHDFNNLLTVILGNGELARMNASIDPAVRENVDAIITAARQAAQLCNQMLAYSGKGRFVIQSMNLSDCVRDTVRMVEVSVNPRHRIEYELSPSLPAIEADVVQVQQVIMNLVLNATDAIGDREGTITLRTGLRDCTPHDLRDSRIEPVAAPGRYVFFEVLDNGCGMDEETKSRIFDPFFTTKKTGRGLGLASVMGIVRRHHGALNVATQKGKGSSFAVLLPLDRVPEAPESAVRD